MGQSSKSNRIYGSTGIWNLGLVSTCARDLLRLQQPRCFEKSSRRSGNCSHPRLKPTASRCPASRVETIESNIVGIESKTNSFGPMGLGACTIHTPKGRHMAGKTSAELRKSYGLLSKKSLFVVSALSQLFCNHQISCQQH